LVLCVWFLLVVNTSASDCLERLVPKMICYVSRGTLNSTHSLTGHWDAKCCQLPMILETWHHIDDCSVDECLVRLKTRLCSTKSSPSVRKDLLEFNTRYETMMSWLIQKEKMASLLVPVGCELAVLSNQLLQTRVSYRADC